MKKYIALSSHAEDAKCLQGNSEAAQDFNSLSDNAYSTTYVSFYIRKAESSTDRAVYYSGAGSIFAKVNLCEIKNFSIFFLHARGHTRGKAILDFSFLYLPSSFFLLPSPPLTTSYLIYILPLATTQPQLDSITPQEFIYTHSPPHPRLAPLPLTQRHRPYHIIHVLDRWLP